MANDPVVVRDSEPQAVQPAITPMQMLNMAVAKGVDTEQLTKLMDLQERWEKNEARKAFVLALGEFKRNPPAIVKSKEVSFGAGKTSYKHATLDNASEAIGLSLSQHGLSHRWEVKQLDGGLIQVSCLLTHNQGHSEVVTMQASPDTSGSKNSIQAIGSTTSYLQRYTLFAAVGLAPKDADNDGAGEKNTMAETAKNAYLAEIAKLTTKDEGNALWAKIAEACQKSGDIPAYDELKKAMAAKMKTLPAGGQL